MTRSRAKRTKRALAKETEEMIGPDRSRVVHEFDDGWTIRQMLTYGDLQREGELMRSCLAPADLGRVGDHELWHRHPGQSAAAEYFSVALPDGAELYSLRDPHNRPHASIEDRVVYGPANSRPKPAYLDRIREWRPACRPLRSVRAEAFRTMNSLRPGTGPWLAARRATRRMKVALAGGE